MLKAPFLKADIFRWVSTSRILASGKILLMLTAPFALLFTYGKVQAHGRAVAEQRVEQLTLDVHTLANALALAEKYNAAQQIRLQANATDNRALSNDTSEVLDLPAPISVVDLLRPYSFEDND